MTTILSFDRRAATSLSGLVMLAALALGLASHGSGPVSIVLVVLGAGVGLSVLAPPAARALLHHRSLWILVVAVALAIVWLVVGLHQASRGGPGYWIRNGSLVSGYTFPFYTSSYQGWPWRIGHTSVLPLVLALVSAGGGLVLIADAVRVQLGLAPTQLTPWRALVAPANRGAQIVWRIVPGIALIATAAALGIGLAEAYVSGHAFAETVVVLVIGGWAATLIGGPVLIGLWLTVDRDKATQAREAERQRFAAHLHDSVLQTLALVQRQAHDPAAVTRLARRQEHALRAWMAGETELVSETLGAALREVVAEVEDEYAITIECTALGDRPLDRRGETLIAATREALRNAARHAPGAAVFVFGEIDAAHAELFVRDDGPGFELDAVPTERRGIRDAVVGRLASIGGTVDIDTAPGEGTEVVLRLPAGAR